MPDSLQLFMSLPMTILGITKIFLMNGKRSLTVVHNLGSGAYLGPFQTSIMEFLEKNI